jgi:pyruvate/2-oxoglutarate dehydrogenase complex dihydrolipoamide acyltransferase (E2) component
MKLIQDFIRNVLLEAALDSRIENGMLEVCNPEHLEVLADHLFERGLDVEFVNEIVTNLQDGKYPDRQAYNKKGWLVTFPSADYKNAAIQKGTHFGSDPTHGKGGMHLYYKSKGKQARQTQQAVTTTDPVTGQPISAPAAPAPAAPAPAAPAPAAPQPADASPAAVAPSGGQTATPSSGEKSSLPSSGGEAPATDEPTTPATSAPSDGDSVPTSAPATTPSSAPVVPAAPQLPSVIEISKKFAASKNWQSTPYGDWNGANGEKVAVTAYDGQVVPTNHSDRQTLSSLIEKSSKT